MISQWLSSFTLSIRLSLQDGSYVGRQTQTQTDSQQAGKQPDGQTSSWCNDEVQFVRLGWIFYLLEEWERLKEPKATTCLSTSNDSDKFASSQSKQLTIAWLADLSSTLIASASSFQLCCCCCCCWPPAWQYNSSKSSFLTDKRAAVWKLLDEGHFVNSPLPLLTLSHTYWVYGSNTCCSLLVALCLKWTLNTEHKLRRITQVLGRSRNARPTATQSSQSTSSPLCSGCCCCCWRRRGCHLRFTIQLGSSKWACCRSLVTSANTLHYTKASSSLLFQTPAGQTVY